MQKKYWNFMVQVKSSCFYLDIYAEHSYCWDRRIKMFTAITSSASIAAWAIWEHLSFAWSVIIAFSQILNAIKEYLPFSRRQKILSKMNEALKTLYHRIEYNWFKVANGELKETEINKFLFDFKKEYDNIQYKHLNEELLVEKTSYMKCADEKTYRYFKNNF